MAPPGPLRFGTCSESNPPGAFRRQRSSFGVSASIAPMKRPAALLASVYKRASLVSVDSGTKVRPSRIPGSAARPCPSLPGHRDRTGEASLPAASIHAADTVIHLESEHFSPTPCHHLDKCQIRAHKNARSRDLIARLRPPLTLPQLKCPSTARYAKQIKNKDKSDGYRDFLR